MVRIPYPARKLWEFCILPNFYRIVIFWSAEIVELETMVNSYKLIHSAPLSISYYFRIRSFDIKIRVKGIYLISDKEWIESIVSSPISSKTSERGRNLRFRNRLYSLNEIILVLGHQRRERFLKFLEIFKDMERQINSRRYRVGIWNI